MSASSRPEILFLRNKANRCAAVAKTIDRSARIEKARPEMEFSEPRGIEVKIIPELDLREDVSVALARAV